jgi:uncharacterized membrane protein YjjP (DUF1212 family)
MSSPISVCKVYGRPILLATITLAGLLFALFGDGVWDRLSWIFMAAPIAVMAYKYCRPSN